MSEIFFFQMRGGYMSIGSTSAGSTGRVEFDGIAAADRADDSRDLYVYCKDILPLVQGKLEATSMAQNIKTTDENGNPTTISVNAKNVIKCSYGGDNDCSNRAFPPDVRKGEIVRIFNMGDSDQWYWRGSDRTQSLRRTERVRWCANNTLENNTPMTGSNTYYFEMDTRTTKAITISTCKSDGEAFAYKFCISPAEKKVTLTDDQYNQISIDSENTCITLANHDGSFIKLDKKDITIACEGKINIQSKESSVDVKAMTTVSMGSGGKSDDCKTGMVMDDAGNIDIVAKSGNVSITAKSNMTLKFSQSGSLGGGQALKLYSNAIALSQS